jgi:hypothetical protein
VFNAEIFCDRAGLRSDTVIKTFIVFLTFKWGLIIVNFSNENNHNNQDGSIKEK